MIENDTQRIARTWFGGLTILLSMQAVPPTYAAHPPITAVAFSPHGDVVITVSQAGLRILSWPELRPQKTVKAAAANLHCLGFSPNGKLLAIGGGHPSEDGVVQVYSWPELESIATFDDHFDSVRAVVWQNDRRLLSASIDREIKRWDIERQGQAIGTLQGHSRAVTAMVLLRDGKSLVTAGVDQSVRVWNVDTAKLIRSLNQHTKPIHDLALRPAREGLPMVATAAGDRTIRFWQPTIGRMVRYVRLDATPLSIAWLPDASQIVAACTDGQIRIVDPDEVQVTHTIPAVSGWAYAVAIHPSGDSIAVGGADGQLRRIEHRGRRRSSD